MKLKLLSAALDSGQHHSHALLNKVPASAKSRNPPAHKPIRLILNGLLCSLDGLRAQFGPGTTSAGCG